MDIRVFIRRAETGLDFPSRSIKGATPYSKLDTSGDDTLEFWGEFHKSDWDISPIIGTSPQDPRVFIRISDKNGTYEVLAEIPHTDSQCNETNDHCFKPITNPDGYLFKDLSQPQDGIQKVRIVEKNPDEDLWSIEIKGKDMDQHADWDDLWNAADLELIWSVEIEGKVTLRSNIKYVEAGGGDVLKHPK